MFMQLIQAVLQVMLQLPVLEESLADLLPVQILQIQLKEDPIIGKSVLGC